MTNFIILMQSQVHQRLVKEYAWLVDRASSSQLRIELAHADLLRRVEPVASMMYNRCEGFEVLLDCRF
jgi:hypothetical protein